MESDSDRLPTRGLSGRAPVGGTCASGAPSRDHEPEDSIVFFSDLWWSGQPEKKASI